MIPYTPHPILFSIGPVAIRYYSIAYLLGFLFVYFALKRKYTAERAEDALVWIILATIVGGRLGEFIFYSPSTFWTNPLEILYIWHGGMSFHGALLALIGVTVWYTRKHKLDFWEFTDAVIIPITIAIGLGRIANFLNGELAGTVTNVAWCMNFPGYTGCRHPSQLYEAAYSFLLAGVLWLISRTKRAPGVLFTAFIFGYGVLRFFTNFVRDEPRLFGISTGQYLSFAMILVAVIIAQRKYYKRPKARKSR